jgi:hypothetical protein
VNNEPTASGEPVAWMDEINTFVLNKDYKQFPKNLQNGMIPLYTAPQSHPAKTLTDEEILQEAWYILATQWQRKAQEK